MKLQYYYHKLQQINTLLKLVKLKSCRVTVLFGVSLILSTHLYVQLNVCVVIDKCDLCCLYLNDRTIYKNIKALNLWLIFNFLVT